MKSELERRISLLQERAKLVMEVQADHAIVFVRRPLELYEE